MLGCDKCGEWFHDECLGLTESEIGNIETFYCNECLNVNNDLLIVYRVMPTYISKNLKNEHYCYCHESEYGKMVECNKCKNWFHEECIGMTDSEMKSLLLFFCENCLEENSQLNVIFKEKIDYTLEHTKPLFKSHNILTIHNLYPYYTLLELYKILKFRQPYCMYDILKPLRSDSKCLTLQIPETALSIQQKTFVYKSIVLWNKYYKLLIKPFTVPLHRDFGLKYDLSTIYTVNYDFSNKISAFKLELKNLLTMKQHYIPDTEWNSACFLT